MREGKTDSITSIPNELNWALFRSPMPFGRYETSNYAVLDSWIENKIDVAIVTNPISEFIEKTGANRLTDIEKSGVSSIYFPIEDCGIPIFSDLIRLIDEIVNQLNANEKVVVHCSAGIGRTGMILACILIASGKYTSQDAMLALSNLKPRMGPENRIQEGIILQYERHFLSK